MLRRTGTLMLGWVLRQKDSTETQMKNTEITATPCQHIKSGRHFSIDPHTMDGHTAQNSIGPIHSHLVKKIPGADARRQMALQSARSLLQPIAESIGGNAASRRVERRQSSEKKGNRPNSWQQTELNILSSCQQRRNGHEQAFSRRNSAEEASSARQCSAKSLDN